MKSYENAFDLPLLQDRIQSLKLDGFVVYATMDCDEETGDKTYKSLVIPISDHQHILHKINSSRSFGSERLDTLPDELVTSDPRFVVSDREYHAITVSEERALFALDGFIDPDEISGGACGWLD
jgi:hypothetical protein